LLGVEVRVFPDNDQFRRADGILPRGILDIHTVLPTLGSFPLASGLRSSV
jgi:hypothetical protein